MDTLPYQDPSLPIPQRVADLLSRMTLPEKAGQMLQLDAQPGVEDLVLEKHVGSILHASPQRVLEALDAVDRSRLRIPLLIADDADSERPVGDAALLAPVRAGALSLIEQLAGCHAEGAVGVPGIGIVTVLTAHGAALGEYQETHAGSVYGTEALGRVN